MSILTIGPNGGMRVYGSTRKVSRALSGNGTTSLQSTVTRRVQKGGGYIGDVWVEGTNYTRR